MKLKLGPIEKVSVKNLKNNDLNGLYFMTEGAEYFDTLRNDIEQRGILTPLYAKKDGTLLAGHNRLLIAIDLGLRTVPVRYLTQKLTPEQEIEFIIKDNLLRRHLSKRERESLYRKVIPDYDERLMLPPRCKMGISAADIAKKTGINPKTVNYDLNQDRHRKKREIADHGRKEVTNWKSVDSFKKAVGKAVNASMIGSKDTIEEMIKLAEMGLERMKTALENIHGVQGEKK